MALETTATLGGRFVISAVAWFKVEEVLNACWCNVSIYFIGGTLTKL